MANEQVSANHVKRIRCYVDTRKLTTKLTTPFAHIQTDMHDEYHYTYTECHS